MAHQDYQEMLMAQALNALDAQDARTLETHLEGCAECRIEISSWENVAAGLALASLETPREPASELRGRIMQAIRADAAALKAANKVTKPDRLPVSKVVDLDQTRQRAWTPALTWGAIAAAVVFFALSAGILVLWQQNLVARNELARLKEQVLEAEGQLARQRDLLAIVGAPGARMSELAGTSEMPGAHAMLAFDKSGRAILMARGLPPPPTGKAYQLWFIAGGRPMPGKVFVTDMAGDGLLSDQIPGEALKAAIFAITLEPKDGVPAPTGSIYLKSGE